MSEPVYENTAYNPDKLEKKGGYSSGSKPVAEMKPPPSTVTTKKEPSKEAPPKSSNE